MANTNRAAPASDDSSSLAEFERCLESIVAAITQQSEKGLSKSRYVGRFVGGKVAGVTAMSAFYSAVATFGTAGTGTAIGSLSGAAATNATLYWIGGLVGGGVAAGATVMTFGAAAIGAGAILVCSKLFGTKPRKLETLSLTEKRILCSCDILLRSLEAPEKQSASHPVKISLPSERHLFSKYAVQPLLSTLALTLFSEGEKKHLKENLTRKHRKRLQDQYRKLSAWSEEFSRTFPHKPPFKRRDQRRRQQPLLVRLWNSIFKRNSSDQSTDVPEARSMASSAICITVQSLLEGRASPVSFEQRLVMDALRRSHESLRSESQEALAQHIGTLAPEQLSGLVSTTRVELHKYLLDHGGAKNGVAVELELGSEEYPPGYDVEYGLKGDRISWARITGKANPDVLHEHFRRYPHISIRASDILVAIVQGLKSDGFRNYATNFKAIERLVEFKSDGFIESITDELVSSSFVIAAAAVHTILVEKQSPEKALNDALAIAGIVAGGGYLSDVVSDLFGVAQLP
jgi:dihydroneopterin aldolase